MSSERETRKSRDFWGNEREEIFEDGRKVGEVKSEERGGFLGMGTESVRVEYDNDGNERSFTCQEDRGGFLGIGTEHAEVRYDSSGDEISTSRVEERGGFLGIGAHHVKVERDKSGNEISQTNHERRGGILGIGGERVKVTRSTKLPDAAQGQRYGAAPSQESSSTTPSASSSSTLHIALALLVIAYFVFEVASGLKAPKFAPADNTELPIQMRDDEKAAFRLWLKQNAVFRPALLADCLCEEDLQYIRKAYANRHPYYAAGDFNRDGKRDFAVIVIDRSTPANAAPPKNFNSSVVIFGRNKSTGALEPFPLTPIGLPQSSLLFVSRETGELAVGKWEGEASPIVFAANRYAYQ